MGEIRRAKSHPCHVALNVSSQVDLKRALRPLLAVQKSSSIYLSPRIIKTIEISIDSSEEDDRVKQLVLKHPLKKMKNGSQASFQQQDINKSVEVKMNATCRPQQGKPHLSLNFSKMQGKSEKSLNYS